MKYRKEERLEIGRKIYQGEMTLATAATKYDINIYTARDYLRLYKASENLSVPKEIQKRVSSQDDTLIQKPDMSMYEQMSKEELLDELIKSQIETARAKKGYEVKGDGRKKEYVPISSKSTK